MTWQSQSFSRSKYKWKIPSSEVATHKESAAAEDLNVYPEDLILIPEVIQAGELNWNIQSASFASTWDGQDFYARPSNWILSEFYFNSRWQDEFFYPRPENWSSSFYPKQLWEVQEFYFSPSKWLFSDFYTLPPRWNEQEFYTSSRWSLQEFYIRPGLWYVQ